MTVAIGSWPCSTAKSTFSSVTSDSATLEAPWRKLSGSRSSGLFLDGATTLDVRSPVAESAAAEAAAANAAAGKGADTVGAYTGAVGAIFADVAEAGAGAGADTVVAGREEAAAEVAV
jgi:hypothetical protein